MDTVQTLDPTPFKHLIMTIGELPSSYIESMTYYEMLAWLCNYVEKTVIPAINNNAEAVAEIQRWIETLDIQDEVDHKLDEMVEDGTLAEIINQEIFGELNEKVEQNKSDIAELNTEVNRIDKKIDYATLEPTQTIIKDFSGSVSMQGSCVDNNNILYQFVNKNQTTGDLYRFDILNHQYIDKIENVEFNHGNDLCYKSGKIWAACNNDGTNDNTKIASYDIATGTQNVYNPFTALGYSRTFGICDNNTDNELIVGMITVSGNVGYNLDRIAFVKYNYNTMTYDEYTIDLKHQYVGYNLPTNIERVDDKLYLLTATNNYLIVFDIDDTNMTMTLDKIYDLGYTDDLGLVYGELEGLTRFPSEYYGKDTFVIGALTLEDNTSKSTFKYYLVNLSSKIKPFGVNVMGSNYHMREVNPHVNATATNDNDWLIEDGSSVYPFKSLGRAIEYVSNNKLGLRLSEILIEDNSTYNIGQLGGVNCAIYWGTHTPTLTCGVSRMHNSKLILRGNVAINMNIVDSVWNIYDSTFVAKKITFDKPFYIDNSDVMLGDCNIAIDGGSVNHAIVSSNSTVMCKIGTATGFSGNVLQGYDGGYIQINKAFEDKISGTSGVMVNVTAA